MHRKTPQCIQVDECSLASVKGKLPDRTIGYQTFKIIKKYFELKFDAGKCQLLLSLLKSRCLAIVRKIVGIKIVIDLETSNHIVRNLLDAFQNNGWKTRSKDRNATWHVFSESIVSKVTRQWCLLKETSNLIKCNVKTLQKYSIRQYSLDTGFQTDMWAFTGRLPHSDMKLIEVVKALVQEFWHENNRPSSNQKDVVKLRKGSRDHEPYIKHFLEMTTT
jgi:hypothetical protein